MKNKTDITIILDRSGSMESVKSDTVGGFNSFLSEQQQVEGAAALSLVQFDDQYEIVYEDRDIQAADRLTEATFQPRGMTALLDAVGRTINSVGGRLAALPETERPDKVLFVIMTDGFENASKEFNAAKISEMINHQRNVYKWEFMFIGANQDAVLSAREIGIPAQAALTYAANSEGTEIAFSLAASKIGNYRKSSNAEALRFNDDDRDRQKKAGAKSCRED
ncbi:MAG TPA: vWA domain-containing protein [Pyrinomonadaceae bacterium]